MALSGTFTDSGLSNLFGELVTTYTNPGSAGGTNSFFYINVGGIKLFWGQAGSLAMNSGTGITSIVTLPGSFFTTIQSAQIAAQVTSGDVRVVGSITALSASSLTFALFNTAELTTENVTTHFFIVGT